MAAYLGGDREAFEVLFERYRDSIFAFLSHHCGSPTAAEDLFQEVFLRVARSHKTFQQPESFRAWVFMIARNLSTDYHRRLSIHRKAPLAVIESQARTLDPFSDPDRRLESKELGLRIVKALSKLPEDQRDVFLLRERGGLEFQAIARITGENLSTVKSRMRYALHTLREALEIDRSLHLGGKS